MPNDSKHIQPSLSLIPTDWLCLRVAEMPRCRDMAIFVVTTDGQTDKRTDRLITLLLRMRMGQIETKSLCSIPSD